MRLIHAITFAILFTCSGFATSAEPGDPEFDKGYEAFTSRDYKTTLTWWHKAAEMEHARAQNGLGVLYRDGDAGAPDKKRAAYWFGRSAENGYAFAMYSLAILYRDGDGVAQNDVEAHKWFDLASTLNFDPKAAFQRDLIARRMNDEEVADAERRAQEWINAFFFAGDAY
jgi:TPR repeat protein